MTTSTEYALLAAASYFDTRASINRIPVAVDWIELDRKPSDQSSGFEAAVFQKGSEIVISFAGTYDKDIRGDGATNIGLSTGFGAKQLVQAAEYYLQIKAANPGAGISLTGHSLGGGLASLVGVFFAVEALTFDQAPFAKSATAGSLGVPSTVGTALLQTLTDLGYSDAQLQSLSDFLSVQGRDGGIPNSNLVSNVNVRGEFLSGAPWTVFNRIGVTTETIGHTAPEVSGFDLHAQGLLVAFLQSKETAPIGMALNEVTGWLTGLVPLIFDTKLYSFRTDDPNNRNFLEHLVRHQAGGIGGIAAGGDAMLSKFTVDLNKLGTNIAGLNKQAQDALLAQGIEWYYWQGTDDAGQEFFSRTGELLQYTTAQGYTKADGSHLLGAQNKAAAYANKWLVPIANEHGAFGGQATFDQWSVSAGGSGVTATARDSAKSQIFLGQGGSDTFTGGGKGDVIFAGGGSDSLDGGSGNDQLYGGAGSDSYSFTGSWGKDLVLDSDNSGSIQIDGATLGKAKAAGQRNVWVAELDGSGKVGMSVYDDQASSTGKKLVITRADSTDNTITINNFDLSKAQGAGYLGIKLDSTQRLALVQGTGSDVGASKPNVWSDNIFNASSLDGKSSNVNEGNGKSFNIYLAQAAHAGDTITLSRDGDLAGEFQADFDDSTVDADGAVITLTEGKTVVSFSLVGDGEITDDMAGSISASYEGTDETAESNVWALNLQDTGEADNTFKGDFLVRTEKNTGAPISRQNAAGLPVEVVAANTLYYVKDGTCNLVAGSEGPTHRNIYDLDGNVVGVEEIKSDDVTVHDNTIYIPAGKDAINGLSGNDLLSGGASNDDIDGGIDDDMIGGGAGSDSIKGGDRNDFISSSADIQTARQLCGANDSRSQWGLPEGKTAKATGATWVVYLDKRPDDSEVTVWAGIGDTRLDTAGTEGDSVDAGAGDDWVMASWADDRIQGGEGKDQVDGLEGNDIIERGAGDDNVSADGITKEGFLNSVVAISNGANFADGGAGENQPNRYKFKSCLRPYLLGKSPFRYRKTAERASPNVPVKRRCMRACIRVTPNSIAGCARKHGAVATFDRVNALEKCQNQTCSLSGLSV